MPKTKTKHKTTKPAPPRPPKFGKNFRPPPYENLQEYVKAASLTDGSDGGIYTRAALALQAVKAPRPYSTRHLTFALLAVPLANDPTLPPHFFDGHCCILCGRLGGVAFSRGMTEHTLAHVKELRGQISVHEL